MKTSKTPKTNLRPDPKPDSTEFYSSPSFRSDEPLEPKSLEKETPPFRAEEKKEGMGKILENLVPEIVKRLLSSKEGGLRNVLSEITIPKELLTTGKNMADTLKKEILKILSQEIHAFFDQVNLGQEIQKILTSLSFEIKTEIRFIPNENSFEPQMKSKVTTKIVRN